MTDKHPDTGEQGDAYPDVVIQEENWRMIRSLDTAPATQWITQGRRKRLDGRVWWQSHQYFQSKVGLRIYVDHPIVETLPDWCPQRSEDDAVRRRRRKMGTAIASEGDLPSAQHDVGGSTAFPSGETL